MAGDLALDPLREHGARQVDLGEIVETENAVVVGLGSCGEGMQTATAGVAENRIQGREAVEGFGDDLSQGGGICNVG